MLGAATAVPAALPAVSSAALPAVSTSAMSGGVSGIVSFQTAHNKLLQRDPELLARLYRPFCFDRQKEHAPDDPDLFSRYPVFSYDGDLIRVRFFDSIIQNGYKVAGEEIDELGQRALHALAAVINEDGVGREFDFEPGQIQIVDNRRIGHRRTAFEDWPDPERKRHLMRLWLTDPAGRPLVPGFRENIQGIEVAGVAPCAPVNSFEPA